MPAERMAAQENITPEVSALPVVAHTLSVSLDELFGAEPKTVRSKRGPVPQWQQQMEAVAQLPKARQRFVSEMLQTVLAQAGVPS